MFLLKFNVTMTQRIGPKLVEWEWSSQRAVNVVPLVVENSFVDTTIYSVLRLLQPRQI